MDARKATDQLVSNLEGGLSNSAIDRGGLSKWGITHGEYDSYRAACGLPARSVDLIDPAEMYDIYLNDYWTPSGGGRLPDGLDYVVFQAAVNCGVGTAVMMLQKIVGTKPDGVLGPVTLAAVATWNKAALITAYLDSQRVYYSAVVAAHPDQEGNLAGWENRITKVAAFLAANKRSLGITFFLTFAAIIAVKNLK